MSAKMLKLFKALKAANQLRRDVRALRAMALTKTEKNMFFLLERQLEKVSKKIVDCHINTRFSN